MSEPRGVRKLLSEELCSTEICQLRLRILPRRRADTRRLCGIREVRSTEISNTIIGRQPYTFVCRYKRRGGKLHGRRVGLAEGLKELF